MSGLFSLLQLVRCERAFTDSVTYAPQWIAVELRCKSASVHPSDANK